MFATYNCCLLICIVFNLIHLFIYFVLFVYVEFVNVSCVHFCVFTLHQSRGCRSAWEELADWVTATYPWRSHNKSQPHRHDLPLLRLKPEDVGYAGVPSTSLAADHVTQRSPLPSEFDQFVDDPLVCFQSVFSVFRFMISIIILIANVL